MRNHKVLNAVFLGHSEEQDAQLLAVLESHGIRSVHFELWEEFEKFYRDNRDLVGAFVLRPGIAEGEWEKLEVLLQSRESDYIPFIDTAGEANIPSALRLKRLVYSVAQPVDPDELARTIQVGFLEHRRYRDLIGEVESRSSAIGTIQAGIFEVKTVREAKNLTTMLSLACPDAKSAAFVLSELMINAIEHGNLGITYEEKSELVANGEWSTEVERRIALPENAEKKVTVQFDREPARVLVTIMDMGDGFDWGRFSGPLSENGKRLYSGRGILLAKSVEGCDVQYRGNGSVVTVEMAVDRTA